MAELGAFHEDKKGRGKRAVDVEAGNHEGEGCVLRSAIGWMKWTYGVKKA